MRVQNKRRFGLLVRQYREQLGYSQVDLAREARTNQTHISKIESLQELPTDNVATKIVEVLGRDAKSRDKLWSALQRDRKLVKQPIEDESTFGSVLSEMVKNLNISVASMAQDLNVSTVIVYDWLKGAKLPSEKTLANDLMMVLRQAGASDRDLGKLRFSHLEDKFRQMVNMEYLTAEEQDAITSCLSKCLGRLQKVK